MQTWPQGMSRSSGTLNFHSQIWRLWKVNCRTVRGSAFLGFLPVVHQKWNIRCSDLLHKELRAEWSYLESLDSEFDEPIDLFKVQRIHNFLSSFIYTLLLDSDVFRFRMDVTLRYDPVPVCQVCTKHSIPSYTTPALPDEQTGSFGLWVKQKRGNNPGDIAERIMAMPYSRQGKVRSCKSPTGVFSKACTKSSPLPTKVWNMTRNKMVKTPQDKLFS